MRWHTGTSRLSFHLEDGNTDGTIPSNHLHDSIRRMSELITSSIGMKTVHGPSGVGVVAASTDPASERRAMLVLPTVTETIIVALLGPLSTIAHGFGHSNAEGLSKLIVSKGQATLPTSKF